MQRREASRFWNRLSYAAPTVSDGNWLGKKECWYELMRQWCCCSCRWWPVATGCSVGVNDIKWTSWDGYKLVMNAI